MNALNRRVQDGHISGQAPPGLPDGEIELCLAELDDEMPDAELAKLNQVLEAGWQAIQRGRLHPVADVIAEMKLGR